MSHAPRAALTSGSGFSLAGYIDQVAGIDTMPSWGRVIRTVGLLVESSGPRVSVGTMCDIISEDGTRLPVQVVGFREGVVQAVPLGDTTGVRPGDRVTARAGAASIGVGDAL